MSQIPVDPVLQEWSEWLFKQPGGVNRNAAEDDSGQFITTNQQGRTRWLIPGTWGTIQEKVRTIVVTPGTLLYIVVGSSHATEDEIDLEKGENLEMYAKWADELFEKGVKPHLTVDGHNKPLKTVRTNPFDVEFNSTNPYATRNNITRKKQKMLSVARVFELNLKNEKTFSLFGTAPADKTHGKRGESAYELYVKYNIVPPGI